MNEVVLISKLTDKLQRSKEFLNSLYDSKEILNKYIMICSRIRYDQDYNYFARIDLDEMYDVAGHMNDSDLEKLKNYQKIIRNNYSLTIFKKTEILTIFSIIHENLLFKLSNNKELETEFNLKVIQLQNVINKLKDNKMDKESYEFLYKYLLNDKDNLENNLDFFISMSLDYNNLFSFVEGLPTEEVEEEFKITNLELEKVKELFSKYGYDFLEISDDVVKKISPKIDNKEVSPRQYILNLGQYDNIEEILKVLSENNIKLDLKKFSNQLCILFVFSNNQNISSIINNIKDDIKNNSNYSFDEIFELYVKRPSFFIKGRKCILTSEDNNKKKESNSILGNYDNYILNRKTFSELGIDIASIMLNSSSIFDLSNKKIKKNIEILDSYFIPREKYTSSLSCLNCESFKLASAIDRFIELGSFNLDLEGYNYLKNNLTKVLLEFEPLLYKLINAINDGKTIDELFRMTANGQKYMSLITKNLNSYSDDGIYVNGKKIELKTLECNDPVVENINFLDVDIPFNKNLFSNYYVKELEKFKENELCYNFNGVIISRNKVLRNINILLHNKKVNSNTVLYVITKDSILTQGQCDRIVDCLYHILENDPMNYNGGHRK